MTFLDLLTELISIIIKSFILCIFLIFFFGEAARYILLLAFPALLIYLLLNLGTDKAMSDRQNREFERMQHKKEEEWRKEHPIPTKEK